MPGDIEVIGDNGENFFTYVLDPNPLNNEIIAPEDYLIYVNFRALPKSRSIISNEGNFFNEAAPENGISFITSSKQGAKRYATTNYIHNGGYESNIEGFGIKSINITTQANFAALVNITFYDARGGGLFNGYEQVDKEGYKYNNSELATFFRLPYPLYELTVKGFYGRTVSQCLHLLKWDFAFDAQNGGFEIHATFVGYTDAFMKDILLSRCKAIVNTDAGLSYLQDIQKTKPHVVTLDTFFSSLGKLTTIVEDFKANDKDFKNLQLINTAQAKLSDIQTVLGRHLITASGRNGQTDPVNFGSFSRASDQLTYRDVLVFRESSKPEYDLLRNEYKNSSADFNEFLNKGVSKLEGLNIKSIPFDIDTNTNPQAIDNQLVASINALIQKNERGTTNVQVSEEFLKIDFIYINEKYYVANLFEIRKTVQDNLNIIADFKKKYETIVNENLNKQIVGKIGINLTMQGVLDVIAYNIEAYLKVIYEIAFAADNPSLQPERLRLLSNIGTDTADNRIYPFPECYDTKNNERLWIGDIVGENNPAFPEIQLVLACLNNQISLAKIINDNYKTRDGFITTYEDVSEPATETIVLDYLPLTVTDFEQNGLVNYTPTLSGNGFDNIFPQILADRAYTVFKKGGLRSDGFTDGEFFALQTDSRLYPLYQKVLEFERTNPLTIQQMIASDLVFETNNQNGGTPAIVINGFGVFLPTNAQYSTVLNSLQEVSIAFSKNPKSRGLVDIETVSDDLLTLYRKTNKSVFFPLVESKITQFSQSTEIKDNDIRLFLLDGGFGTVVNKSLDYTQLLSQYNASIICKPFIPAFDAISFGGVNKSNSIFEQPYYIAVDDNTKAYLFLRSLPFKNKNISDIVLNYSAKNEVYLLDLVKLGANIYRETFKRANLNILNYSAIDGLTNQELGLINDEFLKFENLQSEAVGDFDLYSDEVKITLISFFNDWVINRFLVGNTDIGTELRFKTYIEQLDNKSAPTTSAAFNQFVASYNTIEILMKETVVIATTNAFKLPSTPHANTIEFVSNYMSAYLNRFIDGFNQVANKKIVLDKNATKNITTDKNNTRIGSGSPKPPIPTSLTKDRDLKIDMYYYLKRIYDQWVAGGSPDGKVFNYCAYSSGGDNAKSLISRFHVIDRTWSYIGDKAVVNPKTLITLNDNPNMDIKTFIGHLATHNNFNFYALPSYINYQNVEDVRAMFKPHVSNKNVASGATFVFMYAGGYSKVLDVGKNVYFVNDGFDLNRFAQENIPEGFKGRRVPIDYDQLDDEEKGKYRMAAFRVAYADQNQSFFTSINVSQEGAKETAESQYAMHEAFDNRGTNKKMYKGTNLYNIMELRSYKCTVKMLGNMMIQPLMYFQLDNIPFFHGAYLITKVSHEIQPNTIETTFEGYRMPRYVYPLVNESLITFDIPINETLLKDSDRFFRKLPKETFDVSATITNTGESVEADFYIRPDGTPNAPTFDYANTARLLGKQSGCVLSPSCPASEGIPLFNVIEVKGGSGTDGSGWTKNYTTSNSLMYICPTTTIEQIFAACDEEYIKNIKTRTQNPSTCIPEKAKCARYARQSLIACGVNFEKGLDGWTWWAGLPNQGMSFFPINGKPGFSGNGRNYDRYTDVDYANVIDGGQPNKGTLVDGVYYPTLCTIHGYYPSSNYKEKSIHDFRGYQEKFPTLINPKLDMTYKAYLRDDRLSTYKNKSSLSKNGIGGSYDMCPLAHIGIYYKGHTVHSFDNSAPTVRVMGNSFVPIAYFNLTPYIVRAIKSKNPSLNPTQINAEIQRTKNNGFDFFGVKFDF